MNTLSPQHVEQPLAADTSASPRLFTALVVFTVFTNFFVMIEPAPCDLMFVITLGVAALMSLPLFTTKANGFTYIGLSLMVLATFLSSLFSFAPLQAIRYGGITAYMFVLWLCMSAWIGRFGERFANWVLGSYCVAATLAAMVGILARFSVLPNSRMFMMDEAGHRIRGTFKDPNVFAPFVGCAVVLLLANLVVTKRHILIKSVMTLICALAVLFAFSRGAMLHTAVATTILIGVQALVLRDGQATRRWLLLFTIAGVFIVPVGMYMLLELDLYDYFLNRLSLQSYDSDRFGAQARALELGLQNPLGIGPGQWQERYDVETHSLYMRVLVENGLLGIAGLLLFMGGCVLSSIQGVLRRDENSTIHAACLGICVGTILESVIIDTLHWRHFFLFLSIPVGLNAYALTRAAVPTVNGNVDNGNLGSAIPSPHSPLPQF